VGNHSDVIAPAMDGTGRTGGGMDRSKTQPQLVFSWIFSPKFSTSSPNPRDVWQALTNRASAVINRSARQRRSDFMDLSYPVRPPFTMGSYW
jgi:hypothetical protein